MSRVFRYVAVAVWLGAAGAGLAGLWRYSLTPGPSGEAPREWPRESSLARSPAGHTLIMFLHPECPCSRASLDELSVLLAHSSGKITPRVVFYLPAEKRLEWADTPLQRKAREIPRVTCVADRDSREARLFGAKCSGDTFLYDSAGRLEFHGGITAARGHAGDNAGRAAIQNLANRSGTPRDRQDAPPAAAPVFGCPLETRNITADDADDNTTGS